LVAVESKSNRNCEQPFFIAAFIHQTWHIVRRSDQAHRLELLKLPSLTSQTSRSTLQCVFVHQVKGRLTSPRDVVVKLSFYGKEKFCLINRSNQYKILQSCKILCMHTYIRVYIRPIKFYLIILRSV